MERHKDVLQDAERMQIPNGRLRWLRLKVMEIRVISIHPSSWALLSLSSRKWVLMWMTCLYHFPHPKSISTSPTLAAVRPLDSPSSLQCRAIVGPQIPESGIQSQACARCNFSQTAVLE